MAGILFEDIFDVKDIDPEGKKFDRGEWLFTTMCMLFHVLSLPLLCMAASSFRILHSYEHEAHVFAFFLIVLMREQFYF
jgi:hypothetical protein